MLQNQFLGILRPFEHEFGIKNCYGVNSSIFMKFSNLPFGLEIGYAWVLRHSKNIAIKIVRCTLEAQRVNFSKIYKIVPEHWNLVCWGFRTSRTLKWPQKIPQYTFKGLRVNFYKEVEFRPLTFLEKFAIFAYLTSENSHILNLKVRGIIFLKNRGVALYDFYCDIHVPHVWKPPCIPNFKAKGKFRKNRHVDLRENFVFKETT